VNASTITYTSGIGVAIGEVDYYYQPIRAYDERLKKKTKNHRIPQRWAFPGRSIHERRHLVATAGEPSCRHNESATPLTQASHRLGWGWVSSCTLPPTTCPTRVSTAPPTGGNQVNHNHVTA